MENLGYIYLHRKMFEWEWYTNVFTRSLFIHLLMRANFKPGKWRGINIDRGELLTGRQKLAEESGLSEMQIRTALNHLKSTREITIKSTQKYSIIKLNNYDHYQTINQQPNQEPTNNQPTINQQPTTNNKNKNDNKEKNDNKGEGEKSPTPAELTRMFFEMVKTKGDQYEKFLLSISQRKNVDLKIVRAEIDRFARYWMESGGAGKKQKWEKQQTFEVDGRLTTWFENIQRFNSRPINAGPTVIRK